MICKSFFSENEPVAVGKIDITVPIVTTLYAECCDTGCRVFVVMLSVLGLNNNT
jgi:hypothetical protein